MPATTTQPMAWRSSLRRLAIGRGTSILGREAAAVALAVAAWEGGGGATLVAAVLLANELAFLAATPAAGWLADRGDRRRVMVGSDLAGAAVALCLLVASPAWSLVFLSGLAGVVSAPLGAAVRAAVPNLVPAEALDRANASITRWRTGAFLVGPVLGGAGAAAFGPQAVFALSAVAFLGSAAIVGRLPGFFAAARCHDAGERGGLLAGARVLAGHPVLRGVCGAWMLARVGCAIEITAAVALGHDAAGGLGVGLLIGAFGAGDLLGTTVASPAVRRLGDAGAVGAGLVALAAGLALIGVAPSLAVALAGAAIAGCGDGISVVAEEGLLQRSVPDAVRGRVAATYEGLLSAASLVALAGAGAIVSATGPRTAYLVAAAICGAAALVPLAVARRERPALDVTTLAPLR